MVNDKGDLRDFRINTKCAAGTGRALELMAESLGVDVSELGPLSLQASSPAVLRKPCCLMAQIEIRHLLLEGKDPPDIAAAICDYVAIRLRSLVRNLKVKKDIVFTGGVAKNVGVVASLERALGAKDSRMAQLSQSLRSREALLQGDCGLFRGLEFRVGRLQHEAHVRPLDHRSGNHRDLGLEGHQPRQFLGQLGLQQLCDVLQNLT